MRLAEWTGGLKTLANYRRVVAVRMHQRHQQYDMQDSITVFYLQYSMTKRIMVTKSTRMRNGQVAIKDGLNRIVNCKLFFYFKMRQLLRSSVVWGRRLFCSLTL